jgi:hypothetical protein
MREVSVVYRKVVFMRMIYMQIILLCGMLGGAIAAETNVIYRSILSNGAKVEVTEKKYREIRKPLKAQLAQIELLREQVRQREVNPEAVCVYWEQNWVVYKYEMRIVQDAKEPELIWSKELNMSDVEDMMIHIKVFIFDVREKGGEYSILYCTNDSVMIDTQHKTGGKYVSLKVCERTMFKNINKGRIVWMDDLYIVTEELCDDAKNVELWGIVEGKVKHVSKGDDQDIH